jgi:hypothetical protein
MSHTNHHGHGHGHQNILFLAEQQPLYFLQKNVLGQQVSSP